MWDSCVSTCWPQHIKLMGAQWQTIIAVVDWAWNCRLWYMVYSGMGFGTRTLLHVGSWQACEDMLGGGRDAFSGVNFAFLRIHFSVVIMSWRFSQNHCRFLFAVCHLGSQLARLAHLIGIFSTIYLSSLYLCKSWTGVWTFGFLFDKTIKTAASPSWWKRA